MVFKSIIGATCVCLAVVSFNANAALIGRLAATLGGTDYQAYYDDVLEVTWLANANLAASNTFGINYYEELGMHGNDNSNAAQSYSNTITPDGKMNWSAALIWLDAMNSTSNGVGYLGANNWRLPTLLDVGNNGCNFSYSGTDCGYNSLTGSADKVVYSEMASLFYDTLNNEGRFDTEGNVANCFNDPSTYCLINSSPFIDIAPNVYWTGLEYNLSPTTRTV